MLPTGEVSAVREAAERYRQEKSRLEAMASAGLAALVARLRPARGGRR